MVAHFLPMVHFSTSSTIEVQILSIQRLRDISSVTASEQSEIAISEMFANKMLKMDIFILLSKIYTEENLQIFK